MTSMTIGVVISVHSSSFSVVRVNSQRFGNSRDKAFGVNAGRIAFSVELGDDQPGKPGTGHEDPQGLQGLGKRQPVGVRNVRHGEIRVVDDIYIEVNQDVRHPAFQMLESSP